jgi:hypothetical protein
MVILSGNILQIMEDKIPTKFIINILIQQQIWLLQQAVYFGLTTFELYLKAHLPI